MIVCTKKRGRRRKTEPRLLKDLPDGSRPGWLITFEATCWDLCSRLGMITMLEHEQVAASLYIDRDSATNGHPRRLGRLRECAAYTLTVI